MAWHLIAALFITGLWGLLTRRNLIKKIIALSIINSSIVILFVYFGSLTGSSAPIIVKGTIDPVDPLPQALMLTAIVVGVCLTALASVFVYFIYRNYNTLDMREAEMKAEQTDV